MRSVYEERVAEARENERKAMQQSARNCRPTKFSSVLRTLWVPPKTTAAVAAVTGVSIRTVDYKLAGSLGPSAKDIEAIIHEILSEW